MNENLYIPLIFIGSGFFMAKKRSRLIAKGTHVEGIVFDFVARITNESLTKYPVIRFETPEQEWVRQTYNISYPGFVLKEGQKVDVYYNPEKPSDFILNLKIDK